MQAEIPAFDRFWANGDLVRFTLSGFEFRAWDSALPDDRTERSDPEFGMHWNRNRDGSFAFLELHHRMTSPRLTSRNPCRLIIRSTSSPDSVFSLANCDL